MTELDNINATKSTNNLEYFGTYNNIDWVLEGERDGNKVWWYLTDSEGKNDMPAENLKNAAVAMKENIDYIVKNL